MLGLRTLFEHERADDRDVDRLAVLQEYCVGRGRCLVRVDEEKHGRGVGEGREDLHGREGKARLADPSEEKERRDEATSAGDGHRIPVDELDEEAREAPKEGASRHGDHA